MVDLANNRGRHAFGSHRKMDRPRAGQQLSTDSDWRCSDSTPLANLS